ncbi:Uncharacterised protein [Achromobacter ruhlandii]|nr:Uncharacterised protein [Achromobacter ruhlandii]
MALLHRARLFHGIGGYAVVGVGDDVAHGRDGRHQVGFGRQHFLQALFVHEDAVLDRVDAGAHRVQDALRALRMAGGALAKALGFVHARLHFVEAVVRIHRAHARRHDAAGGHDLDQVATGVDLLAHGLDHLFASVGDTADAVAVAPRHADDAARGLDGRAREHAARDGVAHAELQVVLAAAIAQRREAAAQRGLRVLQRGQRNLGRALFRHLRLRVGAAGVDQVHVAVGHAGHQCHARGVDAPPGEAAEFGGRRHPRDLPALDQHAMARQDCAMSVEHLAADEQALWQRTHVSLLVVWVGLSLPPPVPRGTWIASGASALAGAGCRDVADARTAPRCPPLPAVRRSASRRRGRTSGGSRAGRG